MKNEIMKQLKAIYNSIAELNAHNPYRTNRSEFQRIAGTTSRVYLLSDIADAARDDGILTGDEYNEIINHLGNCLAVLTTKANANFKEFQEV